MTWLHLVDILEAGSQAELCSKMDFAATSTQPASHTARLLDASCTLNRPEEFGSSSHDHDLATWLNGAVALVQELACVR